MTKPYRLAVIPARGGSKGLPGKNILNLNGKPLIAWSIEAALAADKVDHLLVSTDSDAIADVARQFGADVLPRPAELASDEATTIAVMEHVAAKVPEADTFIVLQPTSPLRHTGRIDECIEVYEGGDYDNLATGYYCKFQEFGSHNNMRRQDIQGFFYDDGNIYILDRAVIERGSWFGDRIARHVLSREETFEIDDEVDFAILETLLERFGD